MLIQNATAELHDARARHRRELVERTRLRRLVERIDRAVAKCEETHLQGVKEVSPELAERLRKVFAFGRRAIRLSGDAEVAEAVEANLARRQVKVTEALDILWTLQETAFDLMLPWRSGLPDDIDLSIPEDEDDWNSYSYTAA